MQMKTTRDNVISFELARIKKTSHNEGFGGCGTPYEYITGEHINGTASLGNSVTVPQNVKHRVIL